MVEIPIKDGLFHKPQGRGDPAYLIGSRCSLCGYCCFPKKTICTRCRRDNCMEEIQIGVRGKLDSFAVMQVGTPDLPAPYIIGYVKVSEGPLIFSMITGCEPREDALELGEEMELVIEKIKEDENGDDIIGWKYEPIKKRD